MGLLYTNRTKSNLSLLEHSSFRAGGWFLSIKFSKGLPQALARCYLPRVRTSRGDLFKLPGGRPRFRGVYCAMHSSCNQCAFKKFVVLCSVRMRSQTNTLDFCCYRSFSSSKQRVGGSIPSGRATFRDCNTTDVAVI